MNKTAKRSRPLIKCFVPFNQVLGHSLACQGFLMCLAEPKYMIPTTQLQLCTTSYHLRVFQGYVSPVRGTTSPFLQTHKSSCGGPSFSESTSSIIVSSTREEIHKKYHVISCANTMYVLKYCSKIPTRCEYRFRHFAPQNRVHITPQKSDLRE